MPKGQTRTTQTTDRRAAQDQTTIGTGTPFAQDVLGAAGSNNVIGDVFAANDGGYQGNREAQVNIPTNVGGVWGPTPTTFTPQHTTTAAPTATMAQDVNVNSQAGINAGINNANAQAGDLSNLSNSGINAVQSQINSPHQGLDEMLASLRQQHDITSGQSTQQLAGVSGMNGSFGGTSFARDNAMQTGELQRAFDDQAAQLLWADQARQDQWLRDGAGVASQYAGVGDLTAQRLLNYGGLDLANQQHTADINQGNQDATNFNAWQTGTLNDTNADRAAQDAIAQWEAGFTTSNQNAQNDMVRASLEQGNAQSGLNNDFYRWQGGQESLDQLLQRLQSLMGTAATAPGGTSTGNSTEHGVTTQVTQQPDQTLAMLGSLLGAGMQFAGTGGFGAGAGAAAGAAGAASGAGAAGSAMSAILPLLMASERRLKTDIEPMFKGKFGIQWYSFKYKNDPSTTHVGVMEDEVRHLPGVVVHKDGINHVNYSRLQELVN